MTLSCDDLDEMLPEFLDGTVSKDQESAAAEHLGTCKACTAELNELQGVTSLYREHGTMRLPHEAKLRIAQNLGILD